MTHSCDLSNGAGPRGSAIPQPSPVARRRTALLVLGAPGGGSVVLARLLGLLGADLPRGAAAAEIAPDAGDDAVCVQLAGLQDDLLAAACSGWDDWCAIDAGWLRSPDTVQFKVRALETLEQTFGQSAAFVLADPRACRLLPFWRDVSGTFGVRLRCVLAVRHPLETASRLRSAHGFAPAKSQLLWLRSLLDAEAATRDLARAIVPLDELIDDWRGVASRLAGAGLDWTQRSGAADTRIDELMAPNLSRLRHARRRRLALERLALGDSTQIGDWVTGTYEALLGLAADPGATGARERLDGIRDELDRSTLLFAATARAQGLAHERRLAATAAEHARSVAHLRRDSARQLAAAHDREARLKQSLGDLKRNVSTLQRQLDAERAEAAKLRVEAERERQGRVRLAMHLGAIQSMASWQLARAVAALGRRVPKLARLARSALAPAKYAVWALSGHLSSRLALQADARFIARSGLFDEEAYIRQNPDSVLAGYTPILHWLLVGWKDGLDPHPLFSTAWYLQQYPDVAASGVNPLVHYLRQGHREGRNPGPAFDAAWYLSQYPDVARSGLDPLTHYIRCGAAAGRATCPTDAGEAPDCADGKRSTVREIDLVRASGELDAGWYLAEYPDIAAADLEPAVHYCEAGWREGRDPSPGFSTGRYLIANPDVLAAGINPLLHYQETGRAAGRPRVPSAALDPDPEPAEDFSGLSTDIKAIAFYLPQFHRIPENDAWWGEGFTEWTNTRTARPRFPGHRQPREPHADIGYYDLSQVEALRRQAELARRHGIYGFCIYHYWFAGKRLLETPAELLLANPDIDLRFCLCWANENWTRRWDGLDSEVLIGQRYSPSDDLAFIADAARWLRDPRYIRHEGRPLLLVYRPSLLPDMAATARRWRDWCADNGIGDLYLAYVQGAGDGTPPAGYGLDATVEFPPLSNVLEPAGRGLRPLPEHAGSEPGADRLRDYAEYAVRLSLFPRDLPEGDFFRGVTLEWDNSPRRASGATLFTGFTPRLYGEWLARAVDWTRRQRPRASRFVFINAWNEWAEGAYLEPDTRFGYACLNETSRVLFGLRERRTQPKVSVVVPNYNHAAWLPERLASIYDQSYSNLDVVLLDDCSSDGSRGILEDYAQRYPECTRLVCNEVNGGSVFRQWRKGIELAEGALVWIAESDDFCDRDLLRTLVARLVADEAILAACARCVFVDESGVPTEYRVDDYLAELGAEKWGASYVETSHREVAQALGIKNTIPNVSGVVFRKPLGMALLADPSWLAMRICGDWVFYLHLLRGGRIAFEPGVCNYFRRHADSSSAKTYSREEYYREHERVAHAVATLYDAPESALRTNRDIIYRFWKRMASGTAPFDALYDLDAVLAARSRRTPNILISILAFTAGGGEVFPIRLANELKRRGHAVTVHSLEYLAQDDRVRAMLRSDIPVVRSASPDGLLRILDSFGIEVINTHHHGNQELFAKAMQRTGGQRSAVHVATSHGVYEVLPTDYLDGSLVHLDAQVDLWTGVADKNFAPFRARGLYSPTRFVKIGNGMERPDPRPIPRADLSIAEDAFVLCIASRAIPEKGWREAIRAVTLARARSQRDIRLLLIGDGPLYDTLAAERLPPYVHLLGFRERPVDYYAMADAGLLPSYYQAESFPLAVVEALFVGRPVIASNVGEVAEMLRADGETAGAVFDLLDRGIPIERLADCILSLAQDPEAYRRARALAERLCGRFEIGAVAERYLAAYDRALGRPTALAALAAAA